MSVYNRRTNGITNHETAARSSSPVEAPSLFLSAPHLWHHFGVLATGAGIPVVMAQAISLTFRWVGTIHRAQLIGAGASDW